MNGGLYGGGGRAVTAMRVPDPPPQTHTEFLLLRQKQLQTELARVNAALDVLKANPEIEKVMNLVALALHGPMPGQY